MLWKLRFQAKSILFYSELWNNVISGVYGNKRNWTLGKWLKSVSERQEKVEIISEQHSQEEKTD